MKKNLMSVLILALVLANLILTAILAFSIIPQTKKSNELINQVCSAIDLELESGANMSVPIEDIELYNIADSFTCNLKNSGDGENHIAIFSIGFSVNKESDEYEKNGGTAELSNKETIIKDQINTIVSSYTLDEFREDGYYAVKQEILQEMQGLFGARFIVGVSFSSVKTQ